MAVDKRSISYNFYYSQEGRVSEVIVAALITGGLGFLGVVLTFSRRGGDERERARLLAELAPGARGGGAPARGSRTVQSRVSRTFRAYARAVIS